MINALLPLLYPLAVLGSIGAICTWHAAYWAVRTVMPETATQPGTRRLPCDDLELADLHEWFEDTYQQITAERTDQ